jgi:hypothetical protein
MTKEELNKHISNIKKEKKIYAKLIFTNAFLNIIYEQIIIGNIVKSINVKNHD